MMTRNKVRHIPIVDKKYPIGMVSIGDVVNRLLEKYKEETQLLRDFIST
jgi:CBS domain-containing protein